MKKLKPFSELFNVDKADVERFGFFDITPAVDSPLYIDSKLLTDNVSPFFTNARSLLKKELTNIVTIIAKIKEESEKDVYYRSANKHLTFKEIQGTCLGYSNDSTAGRAIGSFKKAIISDLKQLTSEGFMDPELMELLCVFTDGFGCDRSSDLITFLLKDIILDYNIHLIDELKLGNYKKIEYFGKTVLENPCRPGTPLLLVPRAILSDLPVCNSFEDIGDAYQQNEEARKNLQAYIDINEALTKRQFFELLAKDKTLVQNLLDAYKRKVGRLYDYETDPLCVCRYRDIIDEALENNPSLFSSEQKFDKTNIKEVAASCLETFKHLIEDCGGRNQIQGFREKGLQFLFFASSFAKCQDNGIDLCPEVNFGRGPIDFYLTNGTERISIELKKSTNTQYKHGLQVQLPDYMKSNKSNFGYYVFMNYSSEESKKIDSLYDVRNTLDAKIRNKIDLVIIQCSKMESASRR